MLPIETSLIRYLPDDHAIQAANRFVEEKLCGIVPVEVLLESRGPRLTEPAIVQRVRRFAEAVASVPLVDRSLSYVDLVQDFDRMFSDEPNHIPRSEGEIRDYLGFYAATVATDPADLHDEPVTPAPLAARLTGARALGPTVARLAPGASVGARADLFSRGDLLTDPPGGACSLAEIHEEVAGRGGFFELASASGALAAFHAAEAAAAASTATLLGEGGMLTEFITRDARVAHVTLRLRDRTSRELVASLHEVERLAGLHFGDLPLTVSVTGRAAMWAQVSEILVYNEMGSFAFSLLVISGMMMIFFRSFAIGATALIPNVLPLAYTYGLMGLTGTTFNTVTGMIASIAIGIAVDDTIHIVCHFQHELTVDGDEHEALVRTMVHKGRATVFASLVLCTGFSVLCLSGFGPTRYFGIFISLGVAAALVCELVVTPVALLTFKPVPLPARPPAPPVADAGSLP